MQLTRKEFLQILDTFEFVDEEFFTSKRDARLIEKLFYSLNEQDK